MVELDPQDCPDFHDSFMALPVLGYDLPKKQPHLHPTLDPTRSQCRFLHTIPEGPVSILLRIGSLKRHLSELWHYQKTDKRFPLPTHLVYAADSTASVANGRRLHRLAPVPDTKKSVSVEDASPGNLRQILHPQHQWHLSPPAPPMTIPWGWRLTPSTWRGFWDLKLPHKAMTVW
ncbi:hypothetical protein [Absidia glauca]|uniref:Uncharacterized protein n=1 Tax=Absidia glauca TaxID=4829 RepID=A0A163JN27_ABSGL|nr:hypothetical protein [Absidia glauca]